MLVEFVIGAEIEVDESLYKNDTPMDILKCIGLRKSDTTNSMEVIINLPNLGVTKASLKSIDLYDKNLRQDKFTFLYKNLKTKYVKNFEHFMKLMNEGTEFRILRDLYFSKYEGETYVVLEKNNESIRFEAKYSENGVPSYGEFGFSNKKNIFFGNTVRRIDPKTGNVVLEIAILDK